MLPGAWKRWRHKTNDVTFYWGNKKKGIYHIAYRRGVNTLLRVIDAVAYGKILRFVKGNKTVVLEKDGFEAVLALTEYGQQKSWLLSGWKVDKPDANGEVGTQSAATQPEPTFSRQELGAGLINNISQIFENASGDLSDGAEKSDGADKLRFSLADYDEQAQDDIIAILRPFVRQNIDMEPERYIAYLKEKNVNIPDEDAAVFFRLAVIENDKAARERIKRARDQWLFENFPIFGEVAEFVGGADFKIKPAGHEGEEFTGSFISPEYIKYSLKRPQGKNESDKSYKKYLANRKEKLANAEGMAIDEISEHLSRKLGQDEHSVREQILDFFRHLKKKDLDAASVKDYLEDLKTQVEEFFDLTPIAHRIWKNDRDQFLKSIKESSISNKQI